MLCRENQGRDFRPNHTGAAISAVAPRSPDTPSPATRRDLPQGKACRLRATLVEHACPDVGIVALTSDVAFMKTAIVNQQHATPGDGAKEFTDS